MKNPTILRDELSLLNENRSAVLTELRNASKDLNSIHTETSIAMQELTDVRSDKDAETARLNEIQSRVVLCKDELASLTAELHSMRSVTENFRVKSAQEKKLHLGRMKELEEKVAELLLSIDNLKITFDKNSEVLNSSLSIIEKKVRDANANYSVKEKELNSVTKIVDDLREEEKRILKDRLKKEDKIRIREKMADMREKGLDKREEDIFTMSGDLKIIYGRMKELYAVVDPNIDLDKLITQPE